MRLIWPEWNIWKHFLIVFTGRRNFIPLLSLYYLTLPNAHASDIGLYTGLGFLAWLLLQLPSGIIADRYGCKRAIIAAKVAMLLSTALYIMADGLLVFALASVAMSIGNAFASGIFSTMLKGSLEAIGRGEEFRHIASRNSGNAAGLSMFFIIALPFLSEIHLLAPFFVWMVMDIIGLVTALSLYDTHDRTHENRASLTEAIQSVRGTAFFPIALFGALIGAFLAADAAYRPPFLVEMGYPVIFIGLVMGLSRLVWFLVGHSLPLIERYLSFQRLLVVDLCIFPLAYLLVATTSNPWMAGLIFSLSVGWLWGRSEIYTDSLFGHITARDTRATLLSVQALIRDTLQVIVALAIAPLMGISYALAFQVMGMALFITLVLVYSIWVRPWLVRQ